MSDNDEPRSGPADGGLSEPVSEPAAGTGNGRRAAAKFSAAMERAAARPIAQRTRDGLAAARQAKPVTSAATAGRRARDAAVPRLTRARSGVQQRITDNPEIAEKVARSLAIALMKAASQSGTGRPGVNKATPYVEEFVGRTVAGLLARNKSGAPDGTDKPRARTGARFRKRKAGSGPGEPAAPDTGDPAAPAAQDPDTGGAVDLAQLLGVRPPPDPAALYRDDLGALDLLFPLPPDLASLPWDSLSYRNRFYLLVAAWARREADGIELRQAGRFDAAGEVFQECLIRAEGMHCPELAARSYEDLGELAVTAGDEEAAARWRADAVRAGYGQPDD